LQLQALSGGFLILRIWKLYKIRQKLKQENLAFIIQTPYKSCTYEQLQQAQSIAHSQGLKLTELIKTD